MQLHIIGARLGCAMGGSSATDSLLQEVKWSFER